MKTYERLIQFLSWAALFAIQLFFNLWPTGDEWLRIILLTSYMLFSSLAWMKLVEHRPILSRLNINQRTLVLFTYSMTASILVLFMRQPFGAAALITGGSMILPVFEELFFRANLLGSISINWPRMEEMRGHLDKKRLAEGLSYLLLTSLGFALVHDDVIQILLSGSMAAGYPILLLRFLFGFTIGGLYFYTRSFVVTSVFHIIYNLTYLIGHT